MSCVIQGEAISRKQCKWKLWGCRVICENLSKAAASKGQQAASAALGGAERVVAAEIAGEKLDLLESILPESAIDYIKLLEQHCEKTSFSFTTRQLIRLLRCIDLADLTARHMAIRLVEELLSHSQSYSSVRESRADIDVNLLSTGEPRINARKMKSRRSSSKRNTEGGYVLQWFFRGKLGVYTGAPCYPLLSVRKCQRRVRSDLASC